MRRRILLLVVGVTALVVLAFAIPLTVLIRQNVVQTAKSRVVTETQAVANYVRAIQPDQAQATTYLTEVTQTDNRTTWIQLPDGTIAGRVHATGGRPGEGYGDNDAQPTADGTGQAGEPTGNGPGANGPGQPQPQLMKVPGGEIALQFIQTPAGLYRVIGFISDDGLSSGEGGWWALLSGGSAFLLLLGLVGGELLTRRIVRPLLVTEQTAHRISSGDVTARAPADGPREVAAVGAALNRLADRIDELIAEERETVADLSHRLRTPLTTLRLDAEALRDPVEAERVGSHVSELERTLTAVIRAARRPQREGRIPASDATAVVGERVTFWSALADEQGRAWQVELPSEPVPVRASAEDLGAAVDALVENVIAHTPEGTGFSVTLAAVASGAQLVISDDGPGIAADAIGRGRSDRGSSGLGLDIVRRSAEAGGGSMTIDSSPSGGARVTLLFNAP